MASAENFAWVMIAAAGRGSAIPLRSNAVRRSLLLKFHAMENSTDE
jgi:hypothetical protein